MYILMYIAAGMVGVFFGALVLWLTYELEVTPCNLALMCGAIAGGPVIFVIGSVALVFYGIFVIMNSSYIQRRLKQCSSIILIKKRQKASNPNFDL